MDPWLTVAHRVAPDAVEYRRAPLEGGVSAAVEALEVTRADGTVQTVVVRQHPASPMEHDLLVALSGAGFPVPAPRFVEPSAELLGAPFLVMERVDGTTELPPDGLGAMAACLARLHDLELAVELPAREDPVEGALEYLPADAPARPALAAIGRLDPVNPPVILHGDFWPGNVMWRDSKIVALIDWEDAARGDPACDLAGARVELLWRHGADAMEAFTDAYLARRPIERRDLPVWELFVTSAGLAFMDQWGLPAPQLATMRERGEWLIAQATEALARDPRNLSGSVS